MQKKTKRQREFVQSSFITTENRETFRLKS